MAVMLQFTVTYKYIFNMQYAEKLWKQKYEVYVILSSNFCYHE
jgi:hypothetical protein